MDQNPYQSPKSQTGINPKTRTLLFSQNRKIFANCFIVMGLLMIFGLIFAPRPQDAGFGIAQTASGLVAVTLILIGMEIRFFGPRK